MMPPEPTEEFRAFATALDGQYELECEVGRGGMGVVYRARDLRLQRTVAIKTLPPHLANDPVVRERFLREARTAGALSHPNIVPIHRADELGGHVFFVMGYVDGESMAERISARGRLDAREVLRELRDVADALAYAHAHGVVHRDVKAENILIERATGRAMVTDFGIARLAEAAPLTATGQVLGTVYYLSPEQVSGEAVDARSDIYSLGVVGFFGLAGRFPFDAVLASAVLIAHVTKAPPLLQSLAPETPAVFAEIIDRCLRKDPGDRYQNCDALLTAFAAVHEAVERAASVAGSAGGTPVDRRLVSDTEAQAIWQRAADLQAATGITPRPIAAPRSRDAERDASRTSGFALDNVRQAALEAGIPGKYVEEALVEHGLAATSAGAIVVTDVARRPHPLVGAPTQLEYETVIDGEFSVDDYDLLVDIIHRTLGESGVVGSVGRSFTWHTQGSRRQLQVTVFPRGGKTTIRVSENNRQLAKVMFLGGIVGYGGSTSGIWAGLAATMHHPAMIPMFVGANFVLAYGVIRGIYAARMRRRGATLRELAESLAGEARQVMADARAQRTLPAPRTR
jgi:serine/threonine-protein kinase